MLVIPYVCICIAPLSIANKYDCDTLKDSELCTKTFLLKALNLNVQSLPSKYKDLLLRLVCFDNIGISFDLILLRKTFLTDSNHQLYTFPGYKLV